MFVLFGFFVFVFCLHMLYLCIFAQNELMCRLEPLVCIVMQLLNTQSCEQKEFMAKCQAGGHSACPSLKLSRDSSLIQSHCNPNVESQIHLHPSENLLSHSAAKPEQSTNMCFKAKKFLKGTKKALSWNCTNSKGGERKRLLF